MRTQSLFAADAMLELLVAVSLRIVMDIKTDHVVVWWQQLCVTAGHNYAMYRIKGEAE